MTTHVEGLGMDVKVRESCWAKPSYPPGVVDYMRDHEPNEYDRARRWFGMIPLRGKDCGSGPACDPLPPQWRPCSEEV